MMPPEGLVDGSTLSPEASGLEVAVIGIAARMPRAVGRAQFWRNLCEAAPCISRFSTDALRAVEIPEDLLLDPEYVPAAGWLERADEFDASFFGVTPRDAALLDPQQRIALECSWEALEDAGYVPASHDGQTGVFAAVSPSAYLLKQLLPSMVGRDETEMYDALLANDKDFLSTRISYKLNLRGPSMAVQTACSSSLVAVHLAVRSLLAGECNLALAGGVSVLSLDPTGYRYTVGGIMSPDGHCRPFDADAAGTVPGAGVGFVVLKRLSEAIADRDHIYAVVKGSAVNNDGAEKVGFSAPSVSAQMRVISQALAVAQVPAQTVGFVEAHGTGTRLGDSVELAALASVFGSGDRRGNRLVLGSVKANVGHLDAAAGITGFIKAALVLKHRTIAPTLHFREPNREFPGFDATFRVNVTAQRWESEKPRRAGVSSFGLGGTNAHVVLEEPPDLPVTASMSAAELIVLSARTPSALRNSWVRLVEYVSRNPEFELIDIAHTLRVGRVPFRHRLAVVVDSLAELRRIPMGVMDGRSAVGAVVGDNALAFPRFLFPDAMRGAEEHSRQLTAARRLYDVEPAFRQSVDELAPLLTNHDGRDWLSSVRREAGSPSEAVKSGVAHLLLQYTLARTWQVWGIRPNGATAIGTGVLAAAAVLDAISLEEALRLEGDRGGGSLQGEAAWEAAVLRLSAIISQPGASREDLPLIVLGNERAWRDIDGNDSNGSGPLVLPSLPEGEATFVEATLRQSAGTLWVHGGTVDWSALSRGRNLRRVPLPTYPFERQRFRPVRVQPASADRPRSATSSRGGAGRPNADCSDWFHVPAWRRSTKVGPDVRPPEARARWMLLIDDDGLGVEIEMRLREHGDIVACVTPGREYHRSGVASFTARAGHTTDFDLVLEALRSEGRLPDRIAYLWSDGLSSRTPDNRVDTIFLTLLSLVQSLGRTRVVHPVMLQLVTSGAYDVIGDETLRPERAAIDGLLLVASQEYDNLRCLHVDIAHVPVEYGERERLVEQLATELSVSNGRAVALRNGSRWTRRYVRAPRTEAAAPLRKGGVYLVTGAFGLVGKVLTEQLARNCGARLALVGRTELPSADEWAAVAEDRDAAPAVRDRVLHIRKLQQLSAEVLVLRADVGNVEELRSVLDAVNARWGRLDGVVHAAGLTGAGSAVPIRELTSVEVERQLQAKVAGTQALAAALADRPVDFCLLCSSVAAVLGGLGFAAYATANAYMDAFVERSHRKGHTQWISVGWDGWTSGESIVDPRETWRELAIGPAEGWDAFLHTLSLGGEPHVLLSTSNLEERYERWVERQTSSASVLTGVQQSFEPLSSAVFEPKTPVMRGRAEILTKYVPPENELQARIAAVLSAMLGIEPIGIHDDFLDLGGDSLLGIRVVGRLRQVLNADLAPDLLFEAPTVAEIASLVSRDSAASRT